MKNKKFLPAAVAAFGLSLLLALPAAAQERDPEDDANAPKDPPTEAIQKLVREQLSAGVPPIDKRLLTGYETPTAWEDNLDYPFLNTLLGETPFEWEGKTPPPDGADRLVDANKAMRIRRADGAFRYHSRRRVFSPEFKGKAVPSADRVTVQMSDLLGKLAFPLAEGGKAEVQTQEVAVSGADNQVAERYHSYAWFQLRRTVAGIPVQGSTVRAAVNHRGEIQRLKIAWPHFKVREGAKLLSRDRVIEEAAKKVFLQDPTEKLRLSSRLVYARSPKGDFLPAVQVDVNDGETPYRLTIPVAD